jgi:large subunit ribosomal protein L17
MRHCNKKGRLSRRTSWRKATLKSLGNDLLKYQRIETTLAKAKALRVFVEPIITLAKKNPDSVDARRKVFSKLDDRSSVKSLFSEIAPLFKDTPGGYTRIMASRARKGDGAQMAVIELTKRTISDDDLLGIAREKTRQKAKPKSKKKTGESRKEDKSGKTPAHHAAPEVTAQEKDERLVEDVRKEKAKTEQKKVNKRGLFKRFQRKSMG